MNTKKIISRLIIVAFIFYISSVYADNKKQQKFPRISQMDKLITNIHTQLKYLKENNNWLSDYDNKCLSDNWISYVPKKEITKEYLLPQQPSQINITYIPNDFKGWNKYFNALEEEKVCHFPSLNSKIYAHIVIRGEKNADLKKFLFQIKFSKQTKPKKKDSLHLLHNLYHPAAAIVLIFFPIRI